VRLVMCCGLLLPLPLHLSHIRQLCARAIVRLSLRQTMSSTPFHVCHVVGSDCLFCTNCCLKSFQPLFRHCCVLSVSPCLCCFLRGRCPHPSPFVVAYPLVYAFKSNLLGSSRALCSLTFLLWPFWRHIVGFLVSLLWWA